jgi:RNA polymerase sigma-70 factor (ECF subfamily)
MEVMAPDVVLIADGGGLLAAALAPVQGAELVATVLARASRFTLASTTVCGSTARRRARSRSSASRPR